MIFNQERIKSGLFSIPGWHTGRKIVVIESDDWGSIRMPSLKTYNDLCRLGYPFDRTPYGKDQLESNNDLTGLLEVLSEFTDRKGNHPVLTMNTIMANPDFERIREANYSTYFYEPFYKTYDSYPDHQRSLSLLKEGKSAKIFMPQLHGREHLNVGRWIDSLAKGKNETLTLFDRKMFGLSQNLSRDHKRTLQSAFDNGPSDNGTDICRIITEAATLFRELWKFDSLSFIAPNYFWDDAVEACLKDNGIRFIQGQRGQVMNSNEGNISIRYHFTGQKNRLGQVYLIRNCYYEPSLYPDIDNVNRCLSEIASSFLWRKPVIISTHRLNYIGGIDPSNRDRGLTGLSQLLSAVLKKWPEVEFMSSDQLGALIRFPD